MSPSTLAAASLRGLANAGSLSSEGKRFDGFTRPGPASPHRRRPRWAARFLVYAPRTLPLCPASAAWTGIGALGAFALGVAVLREPASARRVGSVPPILVRITRRKLASGV